MKPENREEIQKRVKRFCGDTLKLIKIYFFLFSKGTTLNVYPNGYSNVYNIPIYVDTIEANPLLMRYNVTFF